MVDPEPVLLVLPGVGAFPRAMEGSGDLDFSMSGLKTAVLRYVKQERTAGRDLHLPDLAASFQEAIVDVQVNKTLEAAERTGVGTVLLGGGVDANSRLRERLRAEGEAAGLTVWFPPLDLPTMIEIGHRWAAALVSLAAPRLIREETDRLVDVAPLYLRKTDAEIAWDQRARGASA